MDFQEEEKYIFAFSLIEKVGPASFKKIAKAFSSFEKAWNCQQANLFIKSGITEKTAHFIMQKKKEINPEKEWEAMARENIKMIAFNSTDYPEQLKNIPSPPYLIFYKGNKDLLSKKQLAIIGSRLPTFYGKQVIEKIIPPLVQTELVITSGLALGIDSLAHKETLKNNGQTIAVLGSGLGEKNIKNQSFQLFNEILDKESLIISEYPPNFSANRFTFPARNRIISGLSLGTLIVEAGEKSGSLITANYALEQNREIFAVPGNIFSPQSIGTNSLIKKGAKLVSRAEDIFEELNFIYNGQTEQKKSFDDKTEEKIYNAVSYEPTHIDMISKKCKLTPSEISQRLSMMELKGYIKSVPGNKFVRN